MHAEARAYVARALASLPPPRRVVELGSRDVNGGIRDLLPADCAYVGVDIAEGESVDVVADAAAYRPPWRPDLVLCCEVLEHAPDPQAIVANAARMLAPGGALVLTAACSPREPHSGQDGGPPSEGEHYRNVDPAALAGWLAAGFRSFDLGTHPRGDVYATAIAHGDRSMAAAAGTGSLLAPAPAARPPRLLLVHPGASYSTQDVYLGLSPALKALGATVIPYRLDERIAHNGAYLHWRWRRAGRPAEKPTAADVLYGASRDIVEMALRRAVDWVLVISGMYVHPDALILARRAGLRVALLFTESPYDDEQQAEVARHAELVWTNERISVPILARTGARVRYLPHAYNPLALAPELLPAEPILSHDVVFVGTGFAERIELLSAVDWDGIDLGLYGAWDLLGSRHHLRKYIRGTITTPAVTAALYRNARLGLNLYRQSRGFGREAPRIEHAESLNPRAYELAASGLPYLSEDRAEVAEVFGDAVPTFRTPSELRALVASLLADEAARRRLAEALPARAAPHTYAARAAQVLADLADCGSATAPNGAGEGSARNGGLPRQEGPGLHERHRVGLGPLGDQADALVAGHVHRHGGGDQLRGHQ